MGYYPPGYYERPDDPDFLRWEQAREEEACYQCGAAEDRAKEDQRRRDDEAERDRISLMHDWQIVEAYDEWLMIEQSRVWFSNWITFL